MIKKLYIYECDTNIMATFHQMVIHSKYEFESSEMSTGKDKKKLFTDIAKQKKEILIILDRYIKAANAYDTNQMIKKKMDDDNKQYKLYLKNKKNTDVYELLKTWVKDKHVTKMSIEEVLMVFLELKRRKVSYDKCSGKFKGDCIRLNREIKRFIKMIK